jgi:DeoR/GlpR family transcriptional regulator of sugar metabolism
LLDTASFAAYHRRTVSVSNELRREKIREYLMQNRAAGVRDLGAALDASEATIRRDIQALVREPGFRRLRGGIGIEESSAELSVSQRGHLMAERKRTIGRAAAALVGDGESVFIGSGSTMVEVARALADRPSLTVITNSLPVIALFSENPRVNLVVAGGALRRPEQSLIGHLVEKALAELRADRVIMGIQGIHPEHGLTNEFLPEAVLDRSLVHFAPELVIAADSSKLGKIRASSVGGIEDVDVLVTDDGADPALLAALETRGVRIVIAGRTG